MFFSYTLSHTSIRGTMRRPSPAQSPCRRFLTTFPPLQRPTNTHRVPPSLYFECNVLALLFCGIRCSSAGVLRGLLLLLAPFGHPGHTLPFLPAFFRGPHPLFVSLVCATDPALRGSPPPSIMFGQEPFGILTTQAPPGASRFSWIFSRLHGPLRAEPRFWDLIAGFLSFIPFATSYAASPVILVFDSGSPLLKL